MTAVVNFGDDRIDPGFWDRVTPCPTSGCWLWTGYEHKGYGQLYSPASKRSVTAHRYSYSRLVGAVPRPLVLDHLCRVRCCVNPAHLEPVTIGENVLRGATLAGTNLRLTSCRRGHQFTPETTRFRRGRRECMVCVRAIENAAIALSKHPTNLSRLKDAWARADAAERAAFLAHIKET